MLEQQLQEILRKAVFFSATGQHEEILLEIPKHQEHGDFATPVAMKIGKQQGKIHGILQKKF